MEFSKKLERSPSEPEPTDLEGSGKIRIAPDWYARLLKYNAERNVTAPAFVSVNETFRDFREMGVNGSRSPPEFRDPKFSPRGPILPGPMIGREVLGSALVTIENVTYFVFREAVQPFNFSAAANDSFSFITPRHRPDMNLSNGYAVVALRTSSGPQAILSDSLFYTESCPDIGWLGSGVLCRTCPEGGYCPGGSRIWPTPGYFSFGEFSGYVYKCQPPEAER